MLFRHKIIVLIALAVALALIFQGLVSQPPEQTGAMKELSQDMNKLCDSIIEWQVSNKANTKVDENLSQKIKESFNNYRAALKKAQVTGVRVPANRCLEDMVKNIVSTGPASASGKTIILP